MLSERLTQKLNEQVVKEFYSAYLYLSIEAYLASLNLPGFANWFRVQAQEERDHAMLIFNYLVKVDGKIGLGAIAAPPSSFPTIGDALKLTYAHEVEVTRSIYSILDVALEEKDHKTTAFLQWFVNEQTEEEANADNNVKKFNLVGNDGKGILMMDTEMAARVYVPVTAISNQAPAI
jgi:ferritin